MHDEMMTTRKTCTELDLLLHFGSSTGDYDDEKKKRSSRDHECRHDHFQCKTCGRWFSSFQALGGHRTSHKKRIRRRSSDDDGDESEKMTRKVAIKKAKTSHECSVCGVEFDMGQALGGHMRRHKPVMKKLAAAGTDDQKKLFFLDLNLFPWENIKMIT